MKTAFNNKLAAAFCAICLMASTSVAFAGSPAQITLVFDLQQCIKTALKTAPELGEADADTQFTASKLKEAKSHMLPQIDVMALFGPAPTAKRSDVNPFVKTDVSFKARNLTWFTSADMLITQPLWTFGKISENMKAATHGIEVNKAQKQQKANEVVLEVKKYYYGLLLAREMQTVLTELQDYIEQGKKKVRQMIEDESPSGDEADIYKLEAYAGEINNYMAEARKGEQLAQAALKARLGLADDVDLEIADNRLAMATTEIPALDASITRAKIKRPEFKQLEEGLKARKALVDAAKANYYPDIFLAGVLSWAYADDRERIKNPYIEDRFKHSYGGVALGAKWHLDFGITGARVAAEQAQLNRLESTRIYADNFIPLQIKKAWLEMQEAEQAAQSSQTAYKNAKKWGASALANFDFGIGDAKEIYESVAIYGKMKAAYYQAIYDYNIANADLDYATGSTR